MSRIVTRQDEVCNDRADSHDKAGYYTAILLAFWLLGARLVPHLPNAVPLIPFIVGCARLNRAKQGIMLFLIIMALSDVGLKVFGLASVNVGALMTVYSGCFLIFLMAYFIKPGIPANKHNANHRPARRLLATLWHWMSAAGSLSLLYWLWTNALVWCFSSGYAAGLSGLLQCYAMALPFLKHQWVSGVLGALVAGCFYECTARYGNCINAQSKPIIHV